MSLFDLLDHEPPAPAPPIVVNKPITNLEKLDKPFIPSSQTQLIRDLPFSLENVDVESCSGPWTALAVANNTLIIAKDQPPKILRIDLTGVRDLEVIELEMVKKPSSPLIVQAFFIDPTGRHCLICCGPDFLFYLNGSTRKAKHLPKFKTITPVCVAWNKSAPIDGTHTSPILICMSDASIYETQIELMDEPTSGFFNQLTRQRTSDPIRSLKKVAQVSSQPTSILMDAFPVDPNRFAVIITTVDGQLIQYIGTIPPPPTTNSSSSSPSLKLADSSSSFEHVFSTQPWSMTLPPFASSVKLLLPVSESRPVYSGPHLGTLTKITWLTAGGLYVSPVTYKSQQSSDALFDHPYLYMLEDTVFKETPVAVISLKFHYIVVCDQSVKAIFALTPDIVDPIDDMNMNVLELPTVWHVPLPSPVITVSHDPITQCIWLLTTNQLYEVAVVNEDQDIWLFYLKHHKYEQALAHCQTKDQKDRVAKAQADHYFATRRYVLSAKYYFLAGTAICSFEHVTLKYIEADQMDALRLYLQYILDAKVKIGSLKHDPVQVTMIGIWLLELQLENLNKVHDDVQEVTLLEKSVMEYITKYHKIFDKQTAEQLLVGYSRDKELLHYYQTTKDHAGVLQYWTSRHDYESAIKVLEGPVDFEIIYKFVPILLEHAPDKIVHILISKGASFDITNVIGAFINSSNPKVHQQALTLVETAVTQFNTSNTTLHNYLVQLYAQNMPLNSSTNALDETKLLTYLQTKPRHYHLDHAFRICHSANLVQSSMYLLTELKCVTKAVKLALQHDHVAKAIDLAVTETCTSDEVRAHWLAIVQHLIEKGDIGRVFRMVRSSRVLQLEDVLNVLPEDLGNMDEFRDDLVAVLEDYAKELADLEKSMDNTFASLDELQRRATLARSPCAQFDPAQPCDACLLPLISLGSSLKSSTAPKRVPKGGIMAFGCGHVVHVHPCAQSGAADCPVCGNILLQNLDVSLVDELDTSWSLC